MPPELLRNDLDTQPNRSPVGDPATFIHVDMGVGALHCIFLASDKPIGIIRMSHFILEPTPATNEDQIR